MHTHTSKTIAPSSGNGEIDSTETPNKLAQNHETSENTLAGPDILALLLATLTRFVKFPNDAAAVAVALWVVHTHAIRAATSTPYLDVHSPAPRCGKSTLFELLAALVRRPVGASNVTPASVFRLIERDEPTMLMDEMDAVMKSDREKASALQSIFNSGYRRGPMSVVVRCHPKTLDPQEFNTFCAKAFAGVGQGNLHSTTRDRCIPISLERRLPDDTLDRLELHKFEAEAELIKGHIETWVGEIAEAIGDADPVGPESLDDRASEIWRPLLAIADAAGSAWASRARAAAVALHSDADLSDLPLNVVLLHDVRRVFDEQMVSTLSTSELCQYLRYMDESPWKSLKSNGVVTGLTARSLAYRLRDFGIRPRTVRLPGDKDGRPTRKGYQRDWFGDAWMRYLEPLDVDAFGDPLTPEKPTA